jgi:hypothetical protein
LEYGLILKNKNEIEMGYIVEKLTIYPFFLLLLENEMRIHLKWGWREGVADNEIETA